MNKYTDSLITLLKESELLASKNKESYVTTMHFLLCLLNSDRTVKNIFLENNISYKLIKSFLIKGNNNDGYLLYSKELLESIEGSIYEEEEINEYSILINVIGSSKTKVYKMLSKIGAVKNKIVNDIKPFWVTFDVLQVFFEVFIVALLFDLVCALIIRGTRGITYKEGLVIAIYAFAMEIVGQIIDSLYGLDFCAYIGAFIGIVYFLIALKYTNVERKENI